MALNDLISAIKKLLAHSLTHTHSFIYWPVPNYTCLVTEAHVCEKLAQGCFPKVCGGKESNL